MLQRQSTLPLRKIALAAAILLLLGQTIAAAHFHRLPGHQEFCSTATNAIADASCAICAAQLHSPAAHAIVPAFDAPKLLHQSVVLAVATEPLCAYVGHCFGRAPPVSV
jgi:hypothetical protein